MKAYPNAPKRGRTKLGSLCLAATLSGALLASASALGMTGMGTSGPGILSGATHDIYYRGEIIPDDSLGGLRGGFSLAGMEMNFGAKLTTLINNRIRYETEVAFSRAGAEVLSRTLNDGTGGMAALVGPDQAISAADITGSLNLTGLADFSGVLVGDSSGGMVAALHQITRNALVSTLATNANGQTIDNHIDIGVTINNIGEIRAARQRSMILNSLQSLPR